MTKTNTLFLMNYSVFTGSILDVFSLNHKVIINSINPNAYYVAKKDKVFMTALKQSNFLVPDGIGIVIATLILKGRRIKQISAPYYHPILLQKLDKDKGSCFYLGASDKTLCLIEDRLRKEYPNIRAGFYSPPYKENFSEEDNQQMIKAVNTFKPDILFVGMTAPKQEKWVLANNNALNAKIICSIGYVFDLYAGTVKNPHPIVVKSGLIWFVRFLQEPRRLWRRNLIAMPNFLWDVMLFRLGLKKEN